MDGKLERRGGHKGNSCGRQQQQQKIGFVIKPGGTVTKTGYQRFYKFEYRLLLHAQDECMFTTVTVWNLAL